MAKYSEAHSAARAFLPERRLVKNEDVCALKYKYDARLGNLSRLAVLLHPGNWREVEGDYWLEYYEPDKNLDTMIIEHGFSPAEAYDPQTRDRIRRDETDAILLHVTHFDGLQDIREELAYATAYIEHHKELRETKYVAGITYREMARVAIALKFREMKIISLAKGYELDLLAAQMAVSAVNGKANRFEPAVVYLPTAEFIDRFKDTKITAIPSEGCLTNESPLENQARLQ